MTEGRYSKNLVGTPETIQLDHFNNSELRDNLLTICPVLSGTVFAIQYSGSISMGSGCMLNFQVSTNIIIYTYTCNISECLVLPLFSHLEYFDFSICTYSITRIHSVNIWNLLDGHLLSGFPVYCWADNSICTCVKFNAFMIWPNQWCAGKGTRQFIPKGFVAWVWGFGLQTNFFGTKCCGFCSYTRNGEFSAS